MRTSPSGGKILTPSVKLRRKLITTAYRRSFFKQSDTALASARAGNVIGGGDWANDRLIPDCLRAIDGGGVLHIRSPNAIRPWQHVLEPLSGYLLLAKRLYESAGSHDANFDEAWNFGPFDEDARPVKWIVERLTAANVGATWVHDDAPQPYEAAYLKLDSSKACTRLGWRPRWSLQFALDKTLEWHAAWRRGADMRHHTLAQIAEYTRQTIRQ